jgi:hypothetical protein
MSIMKIIGKKGIMALIDPFTYAVRILVYLKYLRNCIKLIQDKRVITANI